MKQNDNIRKKTKSNSKLFFIASLVAITPLLSIFIVYNSNHNSNILHYIANNITNLPSITSETNQLMSGVMSTYCKTAPLFGVVLFLLSIKKLTSQQLKKTESIKISICSSILFFATNFTFLFFNHELTTSGRVLKLMSANDFLLFIFYSSLYIGLSMFTYMALISYYLIYDAFKGRK